MSYPVMPEGVARFFIGSGSGDPKIWSLAVAENCVMHEPVGTPPVKGRADLYRSMMVGFLGAFSTFSGLIPMAAYAAGGEVAVHWKAEGVTNAGRNVSWSGIGVFRLNEDELVEEMRGYFDPSVFKEIFAP